jgi:hypothetical protein
MQPYGIAYPHDALPGGHLPPVLAHADPAIAVPWGHESGGGRHIAPKEPQVADETATTVACAPAPRLDGVDPPVVAAPPRESDTAVASHVAEHNRRSVS